MYTRLFCLVFLCFMLAAPAQAQQNPDLAAPNIVINLPSRTLELFAGSTLVKQYPVAIGSAATPTPLGSYSIFDKEVNPTWFPPHGDKTAVPSGPDNPLGYRWMEFAPMYGIHGTNAPWSIGMAVSNGCVRMREEDVEELFEVVAYETPVKVTYDRVKISFDQQGRASIGIYPDVYGYHPLTLAEVKNKLAAYGLNGLLSDDALQELINEPPDKQEIFAQCYKIKVNDTTLVEHAVSVQGKVLVPVWAVAAAVKTNIVWDEQNQVIHAGKRSASGTVRGDVIYTSPENIQALFGGQIQVNADEPCVEFKVLTVSVNGRVWTTDVQSIDGVLAVPAIQLADVLGQKAVWDATAGQMMLQGRQVPVAEIDQKPYVQITKINEFYKAFVYWNEPACTIEITYPRKD